MAMAVGDPSSPLSSTSILVAPLSTWPSAQAEGGQLCSNASLNATACGAGFETRVPSTPIFLPWHNPDNVISYDSLLTVQKLLCCYVNIFFLPVGVPVNILSCVVFVRQGLRDRMNLCLFCLAFVDLLFVVLMCLPGLVCLATTGCRRGGATSENNDDDGKEEEEVERWWVVTLTLYMSGLYRLMIFASGCLTAFVAVDRCLGVCWPMQAAAFIKTRTVAWIILFTLVLLQLLCLPYPLKNQVSAVWDAGSNRTYYGLTVTTAYVHNRAAFDVFINVFDMCLLPFTTFAVVAVATSLTVVQLKRAIAWRERGGSTHGPHSSRQVALVKMLVVVCCIYMVTATPNVALGITRCLVKDFATNGRYYNIYLLASSLTFELAMVNSSVGFFVYVSQSSKFRRELLLYVSCKKPPKSK